MKLLLIDSNPENSFAAYYSESDFIVSKTADFTPAEEPENVNKSPDKLIHCLNYISAHPKAELGSIDAVAVTIGPGSFTGIRVGIAIAKGVADSLEKKIVPVNNFELILNRAPDVEKDIKYCILIQAKSPEYYYSVFQNKTEIKMGFIQISELSSIIDRNTRVVGDFSDETMRKLSYFKTSSTKNLKPETQAMAELSRKLYSSGIMLGSGEIKPLYMKDFAIKKKVSKS